VLRGLSVGLRDIAAVLGGSESRSISYQDVWGSGGDWQSAVGPVGATSVEAALGVPALFACVDIIAGQIAAMPLQTFRQTSTGRERAPDAPLAATPSIGYAPDEWVYVAVASMLLFGDAIGLVVRLGANGWPAEVEWVDPRRVDVRKAVGGPVYRVDGEPIPAERVTHVRHGVLLPGAVRGMPVTTALRNPLRAGLEAIVYELDWFRNGAHPSGVLSVDVPELTEAQADTIVTRFMAKTKARKPVVLSKVASYSPIQSDPGTAGLDAARKRVATDIANACHVPPEMVGGDSGSSMTYGTLETNQMALDVRALMPAYTRLERAISRLMPRPQYVRFNADATVRADLRTRAEVAEIQLRSGQRSPDEVRAKDELPPVPGGGVFAWPPQRQQAAGQMSTGGA
jgi:HK97 family phage portal protein